MYKIWLVFIILQLHNIICVNFENLFQVIIDAKLTKLNAPEKVIPMPKCDFHRVGMSVLL